MGANVLALQRLGGTAAAAGLRQPTDPPTGVSGIESHPTSCATGGSSAECCPVSFFAVDGDDGHRFGADVTTLAV